MHHNPSANARPRQQGSRFPLSLFALYRETGNDPFIDRLDELQQQMPDRLPEKRFFRH